MILLTVGTQLPFDRFVRIVDGIAPSLPTPVFAQIGHGRYRPANMEYRAFVPPVDFDGLLERCTLIVSHAGIGTVVMAQRHLKPLILFPRSGALKEHRNEHQRDTAQALEGRRGIHIARDAAELEALLLRGGDLSPPDVEEAKPEREQLRGAIAGFLDDARARRR